MTRAQAQLRARRAVAAANDGAAAIGELGLSSDDLIARLGQFGTYCPVTWARERRLAGGAPLPAATPEALRALSGHAAEFRGRYYVCASAKDLAAFLVRPTEALSRAALPVELPRHATEAFDYQMAPEHWAELSGFCPVHLYYGPKGGDYASRRRHYSH